MPIDSASAIVEYDLESRQEVAQILSLIGRWRDCQYEIGQKLKALADAGVPLDPLIRHIARVGNVSRCDLIVAYRWACGDFGDRAAGGRVVAKVAASKLAVMPADAIHNLLYGEHVVYSPEQDRIVRRTFDEMSVAEARINIDYQGIRRVTASTVDEIPPWRAPRAKAFRIGDREILFLSTDPSIGFRVPVTLLREAFAALGASGDE